MKISVSRMEPEKREKIRKYILSNPEKSSKETADFFDVPEEKIVRIATKLCIEQMFKER